MMAFGNDFNDIGMFSYCGFSYCSDDGHPQALKTSKSTMPDVEHDGVAIVLEKIPAHLAKQVSEAISIPTIGIGAGGDCDGQVLVLHDMLGITTDFSPRFLRRYLDLENQISGAVEQYCSDVRSGDFPNDEESY